MPSPVLSERAHARCCVLLLLSHNIPLERTCPRPVVPGLQPPLRQKGGGARGGKEGLGATCPEPLGADVWPGGQREGRGLPRQRRGSEVWSTRIK